MVSVSKKQTLGQFNTTNATFILKGCERFVRGKKVIDPCAGDGDLLKWSLKNGAKSVVGFDIDPSKQNKIISYRDSLNNPPDYKGKYPVANPPFLAKNKNKVEQDKGIDSIYVKTQLDDLYKITIQTMIDGNVSGGILIIPVGFLSSGYAKKIRKKFFSKYKIVYCKVFEMQVFEDTTYTVCVIVFRKDDVGINKKELPIEFIPSGEKITFTISEKYGWVCGEEFYKFLDGFSTAGISRWEEKDTMGCKFGNDEDRESKQIKCKRGTVYIQDFKRGRVKQDGTRYGNFFGAKSGTYFPEEALQDIILIQAIDSGSEDGRIKLIDIRSVEIPKNHYPILLGKTTSRQLAQIKFANKVDIKIQLQIINLVNKWLRDFRKKYRSMFLTTFRNSVDGNSRKRIEFIQVYKLIARAYFEISGEYLDPKKEVNVFACA